MSNLINELKDDHIKLALKINEVKDIGISSDDGRKLLISIKNELLNHLKKEDEQLYPRLKEIGLKDPDVQKTLDTYAQDMKVITEFAMDFFEKYSHTSNSIDFFKDIGRLLGALRERMKKEEGALYTIYDNNPS
ncbi:MAG: hemerythrin domain-containing protein [Spirochaetia bacterium]|nr:hemerythrin domain-containing protein [Spirochaetia bacterium]